MLQPEIKKYGQPLKSEDMLQPEFEKYRQPLRSEDMLQPEVDINNHFVKYEEENISKRR